MKALLHITRAILFSVLILSFPSTYGAAMCNSSSSSNATDTLTDSGGSSGKYSNNESCDFLIQPSGAGTITLIFSAFQLENGYDFLTIYDGSTDSAPKLANKLTGNSTPENVTSSGGTMLVRFTSDSSQKKHGFVASWTSTTGGSCSAENVQDNFPNVSYSQNSGSENWSGNWTEVGESDGASAGIARVRSDLCTSGNCLRLGVPSGNSAQNYSNRGVFREADLSGATSATLSFAYRRGVNQGSQTIVLSISNNGGSSWTNLQSYVVNSTNTSTVNASFDISAYATNETQIRFLASGNNAVAGMYIDDINIAYQPTCETEPVVEAAWYFDELNLDAVPGEVLDASGNDYHGVASKPLSSSSDGVVCSAIDLREGGDTDYISLDGDALDDLDNFSVSVWGKLDSTRSGAQTIFSAASSSHTNGVLMFFSNTSTLRFYFRNTIVATYTLPPINDDLWHHYVWTRNEGSHCLFMDGVSQGCQTGSYTDDISVSSNGLIIGQEQDSVGGGFDSNQDWEGLVDEPIIFSGELSSEGVTSIYTNQLAEKNWDGSERTCPAPSAPLVEYRFEESSWNGTANEILDNSGNEHHAQVISNSTPKTTSPALTGNPGTCGYASQEDGSIQVTGLPLDTTTNGVKTTVTFWMNWDGTNNVMPIGWDHHDIWIRDGSIGFNTWNSDIYGVSSAGLDGGWHHIAVEFTNGSVTNNRMYIDGVEQVLTQRRGSPNNTRAFVDSQMRVGGASNSTGYNFHGLLDEFRVYEGTLTTDQVTTIMAERHDCITPVIHHYEIAHDGQGLTCDAELVTIKACTDESCSNSNLSTESVTLDFLADGALISSPTFTGTATVSFNNTEIETLTLSIDNATIVASDSVVCDDGSGSSCDMMFANAGFRFLSGTGNSLTLPNQTSGSAFGETLKLQAVKDTDGVCTGLSNGNKFVDLSQENVEPGGTEGLKFQVDGNDIMKHSGVTSTKLNFGGDSIATIPTPIYHDAGKIRLHADYNVGGVVLSGSSNSFWVSPAELVVSATSGSTTLNGDTAGKINLDGVTATPIHKAGEDFTLTISAHNSLGVVTPNYSPGQIQFKLARTGPTLAESVDGNLTYADGSTLPTFAIDSLDLEFTSVTVSTFSSEEKPGVSTYDDAQYSEVGLLNLDVQDSNYGDDSIVIPATAINIGRFTPDHFKQTVKKHGSFTATCDPLTGPAFAYSGQKDEATDSVGAISYLTNPTLEIRAYNKQGIPTKNYYQDSEESDNDYMKLSASDITVTIPTEDQLAEGVDTNKLLLTADMNNGNLSQYDLTTLVPNDNPLAKGVLHYQLSDDDHFFYNRSANSQVIPFTSDIDFSTAIVKDDDDVDLIPSDGVSTTEDASPAGVEIRFGRLVLKNSFGPETSNLPQQLQIEHFDDTGFVVSADNNCVSYNADNISLTNISLDPALTDELGGTGNFIGGKTQIIQLEAPGVGNRGDIGVSYDTFDWLKFDWKVDGEYINPSATATFGLFRGNDRIIYTREVF